MNCFNSNLRELRKNKGLSQIELAKALGISTSSVAMYEVGKREPNITLIKKIASYFNVDLNHLLGMDDVQITRVRNATDSNSGEAQLKTQEAKISLNDTIGILRTFLVQNPEYDSLFHKVTTIKKDDLFFFIRLIEKLR